MQTKIRNKPSIVSQKLKEIARVTTRQELTAYEIADAIGSTYKTALIYIKRLEARGCLENKNGRIRGAVYQWVAGSEVPTGVRPSRVKRATYPAVARDPLVALLFNKNETQSI